MARGFVHLAAAVDWISSQVRSWRVSISMEAAFCVEALAWRARRQGRLSGTSGPRSQRDAEHRHDDTDQGAQFTSHDFTSALLAAGVAISMDGRGAWLDDVVVEQLSPVGDSTGWRQRS